MPVVLVHCQGDSAAPWIAELRRQAPDIDACALEDLADPAAVDVAIAWKMPHGVFARCPELKLIQSMAAGVDHVLADPDRPLDVPVARLVDPWMARSMTHHVVAQLLRWHRETDRFDAAMANGEWPAGVFFDVDAVRVGVLGLGHLGQSVARSVLGLGFRVAGWSRSARTVEGIETFHGPDGLQAMAEGCSALVCLLPLTDETEGVLNARLFDRLAPGSLLVNVGRGGHLVEADLSAALDTGRLRNAALDVFRTEPLPADHPFRRDRRIWLTPHIASEIHPQTSTHQFVENIRRVRAGRSDLLGLVDPARGY